MSAGPLLSCIALLLAGSGLLLVFRCIARGHTIRDLRSLWLGIALVAASVPLWMSAPGTATDVEHDHVVERQGRSPEATAAHAVVVRRCYACHSARTSLMHAPYNLNLDTPGAIDRLAPRIYRQVVMLRAMPVGNTTHMTEDERAVIARWYRSLPASAQSGTAARR